MDWSEDDYVREKPRKYGRKDAGLYILYSWDHYLKYYDVFRCRNSQLEHYTGVTESYWLVPGTGE